MRMIPKTRLRCVFFPTTAKRVWGQFCGLGMSWKAWRPIVPDAAEAAAPQLTQRILSAWENGGKNWPVSLSRIFKGADMGYMIIGAGLFLAGAFFGIVFESYGEIWQERRDKHHDNR